MIPITPIMLKPTIAATMTILEQFLRDGDRLFRWRSHFPLLMVPVLVAGVHVRVVGEEHRDFLTAGGVFTHDLIDAYIALKMTEVTQLRMTTHPIEFDLYYSL